MSRTMDSSELDRDGVCDVVAWSSSHLSEDDSDGSDEDKGSWSSQSPSQGGEMGDTFSWAQRDGHVESGDEWLLDADPSNSKPLVRKEQPLQLISSASEDVEINLYDQTTRPVELVHEKVVLARDMPSSPSKPASQIPRLMPPLVRNVSLNAVSSVEWSSPRRSHRSPLETELLDSKVRNGSPTTSMIRRGQSVCVHSTSDSNRQKLETTSQRRIASTSSQFWANEHNRRSSRLLDDWKRKEIWHDFKRAEENFANGTQTAANAVATELLNQRPVDEHCSLDRASDSASSSDAIHHVTLSTRSTPFRRSTSFQVRATTSPESVQMLKSDSSTGLSARCVDSSDLTLMSRAVSADHISRVEYDRLISDHNRLLNELESRQCALLAEQEVSRISQDRLVNLENVDRENRFLKEEIQKHVMQELSAKELVKTLEDQLALTARSEDQLKMQTRQLMQQNQTLQADLLEKMAAETGKIQRLAQLSSELQNLRGELQRSETQSSQEVASKLAQARLVAIRYLGLRNRIGELRFAFNLWRESCHQRVRSYLRAAVVVAALLKRLQVKLVAQAFHRLNLYAREKVHNDHTIELAATITSGQNTLRTTSHRAGATIICSILKKNTLWALYTSFKLWISYVKKHALREHQLRHGLARLRLVQQNQARALRQRAFSTWMMQSVFDVHRFDCERAKKIESELTEAKECVFSLSRAKTRLEEKLQFSRQEIQQACDQLREHRSELQLVKHGFVSLVVRSTERQWIRAIFNCWRQQTQMDLSAKDYRLKLEKAEIEFDEQSRYVRSLGDYNKVLRNDLERFQFFSQDKRIAVDVLAKKLSREEGRLKQMEEQQVGLEEKVEAYKSQVASILEWKSGVTIPAALLAICRDAAIDSLHGLFSFIAKSHYVTSDAATREDSQTTSSSDCPPSDRLPISNLVEFLREFKALSDPLIAKSDLAVLVQSYAPEYAASQGLTMIDFVACLNAVARDVFDALPTADDRIKEFWSILLHHCPTTKRGQTTQVAHRDTSDVTLHTARSPWAGQLSDDIIQNQEKLLAVLEHETAVVERAVMEKAPLKHTYPQSEHSSTSTVKEFQEYQCEPVVPPDQQPLKSQFTGTGLTLFNDWHLCGQVRDLFLAFRKPIERVFVKYSSEKRVDAHNDQVRLSISGVAHLLEDLRLYPAYVSHGLVHHHFGRLCDRDGLMTSHTLPIFLGYCALELFEKSLPNSSSSFCLSAREIVLSFFCDLGFLGESEIPGPPRICLVGADVEMVVWPLFEYYSVSDDDTGRRGDNVRVGMTLERFARFAADIVNTGASIAERLFSRVVNETRRIPHSQSEPPKDVLHLDEFYIALAYLQVERCPTAQYGNLGEAVRHWMQNSH